jgi:hypothetical protein
MADSVDRMGRDDKLIGENLCASTQNLNQLTENSFSAHPFATLAKLTDDPNLFRSVIDCFPSDDRTEINWSARRRAAVFVFGVPAAALLLGLALLWGLRGFRRT